MVAVAMTDTHCPYPQKDGQVEFALMAHYEARRLLGQSQLICVKSPVGDVMC